MTEKVMKFLKKGVGNSLNSGKTVSNEKMVLKKASKPRHESGKTDIIQKMTGNIFEMEKITEENIFN